MEQRTLANVIFLVQDIHVGATPCGRESQQSPGTDAEHAGDTMCLVWPGNDCHDIWRRMDLFAQAATLVSRFCNKRKKMNGCVRVCVYVLAYRSISTDRSINVCVYLVLKAASI